MYFEVSDNFSEVNFIIRTNRKDSLYSGLKDIYSSKDFPDDGEITVVGFYDIGEKFIQYDFKVKDLKNFF